jgi:hypothetical protein
MRSNDKLDVLGTVLLAWHGAGMEWIIEVVTGRAGAIDDQRLLGMPLICVTNGSLARGDLRSPRAARRC